MLISSQFVKEILETRKEMKNKMIIFVKVK